MSNEEIGNTALSGTEVPVTDGSENPYPERVEDIEKAHEMALAGDESRTAIAKLREATETADHYSRDTDISDTSIPESNAVKGGLYKPEFWHSAEVARLEMKSGIKKHEKLADRLEDWAGVLHEHPVSDAFKEAHPGVDFSPETLVQLEDSVEEANKKLDTVTTWLSEDVDSPLTASTTQLIRGLLPSLVYDPNLEKALDIGRSSLFDDKLSSELFRLGEDATLSDLRKIIVASVKRRYLIPEQTKIALTTKLLEDIRSGRAKESQ